MKSLLHVFNQQIVRTNANCLLKMDKKETPVNYNGHYYLVKFSRPNVTYYHCIHKGKGCKAGLSVRGEIYKEGGGEHNCHEYERKRKFHKELFTNAKSAGAVGARVIDIFNSTILDSNVDVPNDINYRQKERTLKRHASQTPQALVLNIKRNSFLNDIAKELQRAGSLLKYRVNDLIFQIKIYKICSIALIDEDFFNKFPTDYLFFDATFQSIPNIISIKQMFTIMLKKNGKAYPVAWVLMGEKTEKAYQLIWAFLKTKYNFEPNIGTGDFELAARNSLISEFPNIKLIGCWFYFTQALMKNARKFNISEKCCTKKNPRGHKILKKFMSLALLPENDIVQAFNDLVKETKQLFPNNNQYDRFFKYFRRQWLEIVVPKFLSLYKVENRTNNLVESYHNQLRTIIGIKPHIKVFLGKLQKLLKINRFSLNQIEDSKLMYCPKINKDTEKRNSVIADGWKKLEENIYIYSDFLEEVSYFKGEEAYLALLDHDYI